MNSVLIEPHYLPSIELFGVIYQADELILDIDSAFQKQTFRNRCYLLSANGKLPLIIPVHFHVGTPFKDVTIDYRQSWLREHWGAVYSAYGKSPFFEYYGSYFQQVWDDKPKYLLDLNHAMLSVCLRFLQKELPISHETSKSGLIDLRNTILPKKSFETRNFYRPFEYPQNFGNTFVPNLSILDLLFCQGPEAGEILRRSVQHPFERFVE
jgi:hypothetical protein